MLDHIFSVISSRLNSVLSFWQKYTDDILCAYFSFLSILLIVFTVVLLKLLQCHFKQRQQQKIIKRKGEKGENKVRKKLAKLKRHYHVYNDLLLPTKYGTTQIDHVVVSRYGVFVIETKNYNGFIQGDELSKKWMQYTRKQRRTIIYSPLEQNKTHIKVLSELLPENVPLFSIIAFVGKCELFVNVNQENADVVKLDGIQQAIRKHEKEIISEDNVREICSRIEKNNISGKKARKGHIEYVKGIKRINVRSMSDTP